MLTGDNGILTRAGEAKERTDEEQIIEEARMDILSTQASKLTDSLTESDLEGMLSPKYGILSTEEERTIDKKLTTTDGEIIPVSKIYSGTLKIVIKNDSHVGYYADLNGDNQITLEEDGIIFADLAVGASGTGLGQSYILNAVTSGLKQYEESETTFSGTDAKFGEQKWIKAVDGTTGKNRFYVMALKDIDTNYHYWFSNAYSLINSATDKAQYYITEDGIGIDTNNKAVGRKNTEAIMEKFKATSEGGWGTAVTGQSYTDMLEVIGTKFNSGWFVPSKQEWAAFADATMVGNKKVSSNFSSFGLSDVYWSSSQYSSSSPQYACRVRLDYGNFTENGIGGNYYVRLCTTF